MAIGAPPDHDFDLRGMMEVRVVFGLGITLAVFPGNDQRHDQDRHDDEEHQADGSVDEIALLQRNVTRGIQQNDVAPAEHGEEWQNAEAGQNAGGDKHRDHASR